MSVFGGGFEGCRIRCRLNADHSALIHTGGRTIPVNRIEGIAEWAARHAWRHDGVNWCWTKPLRGRSEG
jgi:hypothetical protein